jgi:hypothetical protein
MVEIDVLKINDSFKVIKSTTAKLYYITYPI